MNGSNEIRNPAEDFELNPTKEKVKDREIRKK